ncbi:unnamed protein product [Adineta steineri]|uniref:tRNA wybutosine-synthesizing protein 4 n=1 Tax=Adineta steineri TaxID=433720 RepID=A0A814QQY9_9BILA|nr:unnamed protein product [Adineta steineri]CAF3681784.1 unnamed protein product [Adineta steineri]
MMNNRNRSRDVSSEDSNRSSHKQTSSQNKRQQLSTVFNKTADVDDPPFSRLFLLIPKAMSEDELRNAFQIHGTIQDIHMVRDRRSQESKGIAYIKYEKASAAARAMEEMNGTIISPHVRPLKAIISSSRREGSVRDPDEHEKMLRLFVVIPKHMTKDDLRKVFQKYGSIINIKVIVDKLTGENKGFAYISFSKASEAAYALEECDPSYKPKFAEPFSSKRHRDNEDALPSSASIYGAVSPPYRQKMSSGKQHPSPSSNSNDHRPSPPPLLPLPTRSLSNNDSNQSSTLSPVSNSYHLLEINNERRLIVRCGMTITNYHISKLFDLVPNMEECSPLTLNTFNEHYFIVRYKTCQFATYAREKLHAFQFPDGEILSVQYYDEKIVNDLIHQSQNGKYGDTSGIGQLIHQMSNLQGSQEEYVDYCNIPLPSKQKYASFDAPVAKTLQIMPQRPVSEDYIRDVFNRFGNLIDVRMVNPQLCYVMFSDERSADTAMETMNGQEIALVRIRIIESDKSVDSTTASVMEEAFRINQRKSRKARNDVAVQGTNDSSILSKVSMVKLGYFEDLFLREFVDKDVRRSPSINRGYYIRMKALEYALDTFYSVYDQMEVQIVNLGAGFDATWFRLGEERKQRTHFIDIDFPEVMQRKLALIEVRSRLHEQFEPMHTFSSLDNFAVTNEKYSLIGVDMRDSLTLNTLLQSVKVDETKPTLLISEVVLTYMGRSSCNRVIQWILDFFQECILCTYEQILPDDGFGQVMVAHFAKLGSPLKCIHQYPTSESQVQRYTHLGFDLSFCVNMHDFYRNYLSSDEHDRIETLEPFDEIEEWQSKCAHYILLFGLRTSSNISKQWFEQMTNDCKSIIHSKKDTVISNNNLIDEQFKVDTQFEVYPTTMTYAQRFGHQSMLINEKYVWTIGGFGTVDGRHRRLKTIEVLNIDNGHIQRLDNHLLGECVFHTCQASDNLILAFFGRKSPGILNSCTSIDIDSLQTLNFNEDEKILRRWRHCSCYIKQTDKIIIFGGKINMSKSTNDTLCLQSNGELIPSQFSQIKPTNRNSARLNTYKHFAVLTGGLLENEEPTNEIWLLDTSQEIMTWTLFQTNGTIIPRYSHSADIIDDTLWLLGGINALERRPPGLCKINLLTGDAIEYTIPTMCVEHPIILYNHQTVLLNKTTFLILGGGGNCFSFGALINQPMILKFGHLVN